MKSLYIKSCILFLIKKFNLFSTNLELYFNFKLYYLKITTHQIIYCIILKCNKRDPQSHRWCTVTYILERVIWNIINSILKQHRTNAGKLWCLVVLGVMNHMLGASSCCAYSLFISWFCKYVIYEVADFNELLIIVKFCLTKC